MYLISIYIDDKTNKIIKQYINQVAKVTGNNFMLDGNVPPHITISSFEAENEEKLVEDLKVSLENIKHGKLCWVTVGTFLPYVLYIAPVLNDYLHGISTCVYDMLSSRKEISISKYYRPFQWFPHTTLGKKLTKEQLRVAFELMQNHFGVFEGTVTKVGIAKTNPYMDVALFELKP